MNSCPVSILRSKLLIYRTRDKLQSAPRGVGMAMELFVLSDKQLNSVWEWQTAIDSEGYPLQLSTKTPFESLKGFLPASLRNAQTGFECDHWPASQFIREMSDINFRRDWKYVLAFRWTRLDELQAAWMAATAYACATDGVVFDDQEAKIRTANEARQAVRDIARALPEVEAIMRDMRPS